MSSAARGIGLTPSDTLLADLQLSTMRLRRDRLRGRPCFRACVSMASLHFLRQEKSSATSGPYGETNPQSAEDYIGDPCRQQMKGCRHHHNYCNQQGYIGPLDAISGGHDTCPSLHPCLSSRSRVRSGFALSMPLANQPRFTKKRIATTTTARTTAA